MKVSSRILSEIRSLDKFVGDKKSHRNTSKDYKTQMNKYADIEFTGNRLHNASALIGPGEYNLPDILGSNRGNSLSTIKHAPNISFGSKPYKKSYY